MFYKIKTLSVDLNMLAGVVQNPDYVDENNCKENLEQFNKEYDYIIEKLSEIRQEVENLHNEIGANRK